MGTYPKMPCEGCGKPVPDRPDRLTPFCRRCSRNLRCAECGQVVSAARPHVCRSVDLKGPRLCVDCGKHLSNEGYERWKRRCGPCEKCRWREKERARRAAAKRRFGDRCARCGYDRCPAALHFHHVDGGSTKYEWSRNGGADIREIEEHPERFELLCANCHIESHFG